MRNQHQRIKKSPLASFRSAFQRCASGLAATVVGCGLWAIGAWEPLERIAYVGLFQVRESLNPVQWDERIVVIAIDEASLASYGTFPWSRDRYAALLNQLMFVQPAAIGFDILMAEPTPEDALLAEAIQYSGSVVLAVGSDPIGNAIQVTPTLTESANGLVRVGHVKNLPDVDGLSRQITLNEIYDTQIAPSFGLALLETYERNLSGLVTAYPTDAAKFFSEFLAQPEQYDQNRPLWINWPGPTRASSQNISFPSDGLTTLSFADVLKEDADSEVLAQLQNKIVLVGYTAVGVVGNSEDALRTPFENRIPTAGVYLHAAVVDNLLNNRFLERSSPWVALLLMAVGGLASSLLLNYLNVRGRLVLAVGGSLLWCILGYGFFLTNTWLPIAAPIGTSLLALITVQFAEQQERKTLMDLFAINLSPEMADFIWQHKGELLSEGQIQPQTMTATLLFVDIREFTSISEKLSSEVLLPWLNRYFEAMTDCIMAHGGVVDKYIGDAIMAAFGAPIAQFTSESIQSQAMAAVNASLAMVDRLKSLNQELKAEGLPTVKFGIGLHTGTVVGGTVGSRHRASYSLFGDTVNIAARLQDLTKTLPAGTPYPVLLSRATAQYVEAHFKLMQQGQLQLRGRSQSTTLYTIL